MQQKQGSYRFLDPKFKTFSRLFPKQEFSRLEVIKQGINTDLKKYRTNVFFYDALETYGRDLTKTKKILLIKHLCNFGEKTQDSLSFSQTSPLFSRLLASLGNCWANLKSFSRIQNSVRTLQND